MRRFILSTAIAVTFSTACGDNSSDTSQGSGGLDRTKVYCRTTSDTLNVSTGPMSVSVTCDATTDTPLSGGCWDGDDLPSGAYLSVDRPLDWDEPTAKAGWICTWGATAAPPNLDFGGAVEICCYPGEAAP